MIGALPDWLRQARLRPRTRLSAGGRGGEDLAHRRLKRKGSGNVARNYRLPKGALEAGLIAWDGDTLVHGKVKPRDNAEYMVRRTGTWDRRPGPIKRVARVYARNADAP